ncbi:sugar ABC transporter permease [Gottschalkiaceae bacterium SANA]|nr:sugar ABC transporter permease [Gottschalkiaceae bacterium SANA]
MDQNKSTWNKIAKILKGEVGLLLILVILCVLFSFSSKYFLTAKNILNVTRQISVVLTIAIGMLCVILVGEIDLSVGSTAALAGIACAWVITTTGSQSMGMLAAIIIGIAVGSFNGVMTVYGRIPSFIVTLASMGIIRGIGLVWTQGKPFSGLPESFSFIGAKHILGVPVSSIVAVILLIIGYFILHKTKHGVYLKAIGANSEAATLSTIPNNRYKVLSFVIVGMMCAIGGVMTTSKLLTASPTACTGMEMDVLSAVILGGASLSGGIGTITGTALGALIIGIINNGMNMLSISPFFQQIVKGAIILAAVLLKRKNSKA